MAQRLIVFTLMEEIVLKFIIVDSTLVIIGLIKVLHFYVEIVADLTCVHLFVLHLLL